MGSDGGEETEAGTGGGGERESQGKGGKWHVCSRETVAACRSKSWAGGKDTEWEPVRGCEQEAVGITADMVREHQLGTLGTGYPGPASGVLQPCRLEEGAVLRGALPVPSM